MKKSGLTICLVMVATMLATISQADAQRQHRILKKRSPIYSGIDADGMTMSNHKRHILFPVTAGKAFRNNHSPARMYTYSNHGVLAQKTHTWNQNEAASRPWHDNYSYWRYGQPTALVVPPTAGYQTSYAWGVGQVRSTPIHHQYGRGSAGMVEDIGDGSEAQRTPYRPSSTDQLGVYPVRAPW